MVNRIPVIERKSENRRRMARGALVVLAFLAITSSAFQAPGGASRSFLSVVERRRRIDGSPQQQHHQLFVSFSPRRGEGIVLFSSRVNGIEPRGNPKWSAPTVDPKDDRETRPSMEGISDEEIEEVAIKWEKRKAARKDRITKKKGIREAELDQAEDVIPDREVPLWYALKVKTGMELYLRDTLSQLAMLPDYSGKIVEVLVPEAKSVKSMGKQLRLVQQPLHKGYVFICMAMNRDLHDAVLSPNGVGCFVGRRVPGKGIIPNPLRAKEADRLKERAVYEAGRTIDLEAIPFRPGDRVDVLQVGNRVDVLQGEFAYARGRVTSVKETELNVAVRRNKVEVRVTLPHTGVRKLTQEELDQEAREQGEESLRSFTKARGQQVAAGDVWGAIARSNEAAAGGKAAKQEKKKAPERRGPSLYRILSDYVNLESFDPNKPPNREEMVQGMLELTGQKEDIGGYYEQKFDMAVKAWNVWKQYLEEKDDRKKKNRERAIRRKTMGYDEFNDNWKGASWTKDRNERGRDGGGRGWDTSGIDLDSEEDKDWRLSYQRNRSEEKEGGDRREGGDRSKADDELESQFLDRLMMDLDGPSSSSSSSPTPSSFSRPPPPPRPAATIGDDEIDALINSAPVPNPRADRRERGGDRFSSSFSTSTTRSSGSRRFDEEEEEGGGGGGAEEGQAEAKGTLSDEEQKELDLWLSMISGGKEAQAAQAAAGRSPPPSSRIEPMGGQPNRAKPASRQKDFSLDPQEEKELNEWLSRFDAEYAEGADGLSMSKKSGGRDERDAAAGPNLEDSFNFGGSAGRGGGREDDDILQELLGLGSSSSSASKRSPPPSPASTTTINKKSSSNSAADDDEVDKELADLLAKLEAAEAKSGHSVQGSNRGETKGQGQGQEVDEESLGGLLLGSERLRQQREKEEKGVDSGRGLEREADEFDLLLSPTASSKRAPTPAKGTTANRGLNAKRPIAGFESFLPSFEDGGIDEFPPSSSRIGRSTATTAGGSSRKVGWNDPMDEEEEDDDRLPRTSGVGGLKEKRLFVSHSGDDDEEEDDATVGMSRRIMDRWGRPTSGGADEIFELGAYGEDPEEAPGQFIEEGMEDALEMGRPKNVKQGFMFDDGESPVGRGGGGAGGGRGRGLDALDEDEDLFGGLSDNDPLLGGLEDLEDLEKLDKMFAEEAKNGGLGGLGGGGIKKRERSVVGGKGGAAAARPGNMDIDLDDDDWGGLLGDDFLKELRSGDLGELGLDLGGGGGATKKGGKPAAASKSSKAASSPTKRKTSSLSSSKASTAAAKSSSRDSNSDSLEASAINAMKVADLKSACKTRGLPVTGTKGELQARLRDAL